MSDLSAVLLPVLDDDDADDEDDDDDVDDDDDDDVCCVSNCNTRGSCSFVSSPLRDN